MNKNKITARPCKEKPNTWEIEDEKGYVLPTHYSSREECLEVASELCKECNCKLVVEKEGLKR